MSFDSIGFILFFPIVILVYFLFSKKYRYLWLLDASYIFYACWNIKYMFFLLFSTLTTYLCARLMQGNRKKQIFHICLICNLFILYIFKHGLWTISIVDRIANFLNVSITIPSFDIVLPIGMSFYMLQSLGYLIDIYRKKAKPETNFAKYALFVSFFPTILSGPIERSDNLLKQISKGTDFSYDNAKTGLLLIVWGYFEKILIANRISQLVSYAYSNYTDMTGAALAFVIFLYAIQIYADFAGYSYIAIGTARMLGFELVTNFRQPYFSININEFWRRWHMSLSQWLRDYVYISIGGSRCSKLKTYRNLIFTFLISGLWHGTGITYIVWGGLHGIYQVIGNASLEFREKIKCKLKINARCWSYRLYQGIITFIMVDFAWLFFRSSSMKQAIAILRKITTDFRLGDTILYNINLFNMEGSRFFLLIVEIVILLLIDILHEMDIHIIPWLNQQNFLFRWSIYFIIVIALIIGTLYNYGADASTFIYTQF